MWNPLQLFDSLAQGYHWSHDQMMRLTVPQILMYGDASKRNSARLKKKCKSKESGGDSEDGSVRLERKRVEDLKGAELTAYLSRI